MSLKEPLISIVIPNYNYGQFLGEAIESVLNQTYRNIQVIVVDNESTDDSISVASKYLDSITLVEKKHGGVSSARNLGITFAKGNYICFLDSDDTWVPEKLEMQLKVIQGTGADVVYSGVNLCDSKLFKNEELLPEYRGDCSPYFLKHPTKAIILLGCSNAMIDRAVLEQVGNFKTYLHFSADWDFFRRICKTAKVENVSIPQINYRRHSLSMSSGSLASFYTDNELAISDFLNEIRADVSKKYSSRLQFSLWCRFQIQAIKALLRSGNVFEAVKRSFRIFLYFLK